MIRLKPPVPFKKYVSLVHIPIIALAIICSAFIGSWETVLASFLISYIVIYIYGTNIFWHRYWSHKQFKTYNTFEKFFTVAGLFSLAGGPIGYALTHRTHHAFSDTDKDPHSPIHGKYHAFIGWLFNAHKSEANILLVKDLLKTRWLVSIENNKIFIIWTVLLLVALISTDILLGILLTSLLTFVIECSINTFLHSVEKREATNAPELLSILTAGGLKHGLHHESLKLSKEDPGFYFVKIISRTDA